MLAVFRFTCLLGFLALLNACDLGPSPDADTIYLNGTILTMADPPTANALSVRDGKIQAIGTQDGVLRHKGNHTRVVDLNGQTLLPGFYASHTLLAAEVATLGSMEAAQNAFASQGFTTVVDGYADTASVKQLQDAALSDKLSLDFIALPLYSDAEALLKDKSWSFGSYRRRLKLGGVKLVLDGDSRDLSAWLALPYHSAPGKPENWRGEPLIPFSELAAFYRQAIKRHLQVFTHAVGDAAIDAIIQVAYEVKLSAEQNQRHVVLFSRFMRRNQLEQFAKLGLIPCFNSSQIYLQGDADLQYVGQASGEFQSPMKSAQTLNLPFSNHCQLPPQSQDSTTNGNNPPGSDSDSKSNGNGNGNNNSNNAPQSTEHLPGSLLAIWSSVNRLSQSGVILGPDERIDPDTALKALTIQAAYQFFEDDTKGSLSPGKLADMVILSDNPLTIAPGMLREIRVLETIKEGKTIFSQRTAAPASAISDTALPAKDTEKATETDTSAPPAAGHGSIPPVN